MRLHPLRPWFVSDCLVRLRSAVRRRAAGAAALALVFVATAAALDPQRRPDQYGYGEWNTNHGIPYTSIRGLFQSADGYLWLFTRGGLARFDGVTFTQYTHATVPVLTDDDVYGLAEDAAGRMWAATNRGLVWHRNGRWWRPPELRELDQAGVRWVGRDGDAMLVATATQILRYADGRLAPAALPAGVAFSALRGIERGPAGDWVVIAHPSWWIKDGVARRIETAGGTTVDDLYSAVPHPDGGWWLGAELGLYRCEEGRATARPVVGGRTVPSARSLLVDRDKSLWLGTRGELLRVSAGGNVTVVERPGVDSIANFLCFLEDREGNIWGGNDSGLVVLSETKVDNLTYRDGLPGRSVVAALATRDGGVWFGVWGGGLTRLGRDGRIERIYGAADGLPNQAVWNLTEAPDGALWMGFQAVGIARLHDGVFTHFADLPEVRNRLRDVKVDRAGEVWISTITRGLVRFAAGSSRRLELPGAETTGALCVDAQDRLWVAFPGGVGCVDKATDGWREKLLWPGGPFGDATAMLDDPAGGLWIFRDDCTIHRLHDGRMESLVLPAWVGRLTYSALLHRGELWVNMRNGIVRLPVSEFEAVVAGRKAEPEFEFYNEIDGLRGVAPNVFGGQGATVGPDGLLYFATSKGVVTIDPARIRKNTRPPDVLVEKLVVDKVSHDAREVGALRPGRGEVEIHFTALGLTHAAQNRFRYRLLPLEPEWVEAGRNRAAYYGGLPPGRYRFEVSAANADRVWNRGGAACEFKLPPHFYQTFWFYGALALAVPLGIWGYVRWHDAALRREKQRLELGIARRTQEIRETNDRLTAQVAETLVKAAELERSEERYRRLNDELEARVTKRTAELQTANQELESFSYSVSHDLRAPLRGIDGWSLALMEDYGAKLDATALGYLNRVRAESQRLGLLIDDLLKLARTTRAELHPVDVDLGALARGIATRLAEMNPAPAVEFVCAPDLKTHGDPALLDVALFNLIENAWKFSSKRPAPRVEVGRVATVGGPAFFVRDNGAGFDMRHAKNLFGVFQRMHSQEQFPGTGVGLATVHRILHRHGGRIWAESVPDVQTTFYFVLPAAPVRAAAPLSSVPRLS